MDFVFQGREIPGLTFSTFLEWLLVPQNVAAPVFPLEPIGFQTSCNGIRQPTSPVEAFYSREALFENPGTPRRLAGSENKDLPPWPRPLLVTIASLVQPQKS